MLDKVTKYIGIGFAFFWLVFTFLEYWQYHEDTRRSIELFQFTGLALLLLGIGFVFLFVQLRFRDRKALQRLQNGLGIICMSTLLAVISMNAFFHKNLGVFLSPGENATFLGTLFQTALAAYLVILLSYTAGRLVCSLFETRLAPGILQLLYIAAGIICIVSLLFVLGLFGLLSGLVLWPLFLLLLAAGWRSALEFIRITLWRPIPAVGSLNAVGLSVFYLFLVLISMNFTQVARPFPTGFDAITHYVNISALVHEYQGLVQGYGLYNWSLFMALGYLLFDQTAVTLMLSFAGTVLSLFALYELSRKWLDPNYSLLVIFLFYSMPMSAWLSYRDMKVDMGLLFFSLLIVLLLHDWLTKPEPETDEAVNPQKKVKKQDPKPQENLLRLPRLNAYLPAIMRENSRITLIGILTGFAIGIKLSALIILLALIPAIAYARSGRTAFAAALSLVLGGVLLARLDAQAALRPLHLWADALQWLLLLTGAVLGGYLFWKKRNEFMAVLKLCLICLVFSGLTMSPWLIKNTLESGSFNVSGLTQGKVSSPQPNIPDIQKAYEDLKNGN